MWRNDKTLNCCGSECSEYIYIYKYNNNGINIGKYNIEYRSSSCSIRSSRIFSYNCNSNSRHVNFSQCSQCKIVKLWFVSIK